MRLSSVAHELMPGFDRVKSCYRTLYKPLSPDGPWCGRCLCSRAIVVMAAASPAPSPIANGHAASVAFDEAGYFTVLSANEKRGPACCGDAIKFARYDKPFKFGPQGNDVDIGSRQAL